MKVLTILGTRPEIIRLGLVIDLLDRHCEHVVAHTGQNFDERLSDIFFTEMGIRAPDVHFGVRAEGFAEQAGQILTRSEQLLRERRPDRLLILGDTNSGLSAFVAARLGIPVFHMEAGNRCYDFRVPEEVNRRIIDQCSSVHLPYTRRSRENLLREGFPAEKIHVTGNPIREVLIHHAAAIDRSDVMARFGLAEKRYFLVTLHRAENVDIEARLRTFIDSIRELHRRYGFPVICSLHPRTRSKLAKFGISADDPGIRLVDSLGFFDFVHLEQRAFCVLTDSGTVQEETCIFRVPNVTLRDVTERPETIDCGSNLLTGCDRERILALVEFVTERVPAWQPPEEYLAEQVAATVVRIVLGEYRG